MKMNMSVKLDTRMKVKDTAQHKTAKANQGAGGKDTTPNVRSFLHLSLILQHYESTSDEMFTRSWQ